LCKRIIIALDVWKFPMIIQCASAHHRSHPIVGVASGGTNPRAFQAATRAISVRIAQDRLHRTARDEAASEEL
jgi:hypothetical protein